MKVRSDIVRLYKDVHGWVGIFCGLFLFTAFFAGAVTMFEAPLDRWLAPAVSLPAAPPLAATPRLIAETLKSHPDARHGYSVVLAPDAASPARLIWQKSDRHGPASDPDGESGARFGASFGADGTLVVATLPKSAAAKFIDVLHQQIGLPFGFDTAMIFVGIICLLYALALVSGVVVLLPSLVKDLFAMRLGKNIKRKWLDVHNALGLFSIPFHIVMALTSLVFAFHGLFYGAQNIALYGGKIDRLWDKPAVMHHAPGTPLLSPEAILTRLKQTAPGFTPTRLDYAQMRGVPHAGSRGQAAGKSAGVKGNPQAPVKPSGVGPMSLRVCGVDPRYGVRAITEGFAVVDPYDGAILQSEYLPGHQNGWYATLTAFFALHFGNYGGLSVRWGYFLLGLAGAFLFYTGNRLWVETRRRRNGGIDTQSTKALEKLTIGWTCGTIAGIALVLATAKAAQMMGYGT
ncbi:MAG: PepSY-associated TM helix domain-containing protein, partial [Rhizomicrobium sp.]